MDECFYEIEKGDISFDDGDGRRNIICDGGNSRGDIRVDGGRLGSRSKETRQFPSRNMGETVGGERRVGYRYQTRQYYSHNPGNHA